MPQFGGSFARGYGCKAGAGFPMRSIAFVTQKGGAGKTTLTASLAVAAAATGEKVVALDFDSQASLVRWSERRKAANAPNTVVIEPLESERLPQLSAILDGLAGAGFTVAVFDTADAGGVHLVIDSVDLCLLPLRPTRLDVDAARATYRAAFLAKRRAAFVLNQCPSTYRSLRASVAAQELMRLGVLAEPMLPACIDFQDAFAAGLGVTEHARDGKAAQQIDALWRWTGAQFGKSIAEVEENVAVTGEAAIHD
jgi:chromosome partitioning protein